jgi:tetratricopeptide (TPR) repeat protein
MRYLVTALCLALVATTARAEFSEEIQEVLKSPELEAASAQAEKLVLNGRVDEGNAHMLAVFPKETRTAAQAFILGNTIFRHAPKESYELHRFAAEREPENGNALFEWAMQQHRAGEFAAAAETYERCGESMSNFAPLWGLQADCLIRQGKARDAVAAWMKSEKAKSGTVIQFESMLCDIKCPHPDLKRQEVLKKVDKLDVQAAQQLISLDYRFEIDWWNSPVRKDYLQRDLDHLRSLAWQPGTAIDEVICAAEAMLAEDAAGVEAILTKHGYLFDPSKTLPKSGAMLSCVVSAIEKNEVMTTEAVAERWREAVLEQARINKDPETYNVAAHLAVGTDRLTAIDREAWKTTDDVRFAASLIVGLAGRKELTLDHPDFVAALKQFPEESTIAQYEVILAYQNKQPLVDPLVRAIKAEYTRLSIQRGLSSRRSARFLRAAFNLLNDALANGGE